MEKTAAVERAQPRKTDCVGEVEVQEELDYDGIAHLSDKKITTPIPGERVSRLAGKSLTARPD
jgi:hypothetical protein